MKLPWREARDAKPTPPAEPAEGQSCPTLALAMDTLSRRERPAVLDLGPMCGDTVVYLADRGARVSVEEFDVPVAPETDDDDAPPPPVRLDQDDASYDLVLAWEWCDFVEPARFDAFCAELRRVLKDDGMLLLFSLNQTPPEDGAGERPGRYRVLADNKLLREPAEGEPRRRWQYPTRRIEAALEPLSIQKLHLQRNQIREFLAHKPRARRKAE